MSFFEKAKLVPKPTPKPRPIRTQPPRVKPNTEMIELNSKINHLETILERVLAASFSSPEERKAVSLAAVMDSMWGIPLGMMLGFLFKQWNEAKEKALQQSKIPSAPQFKPRDLRDVRERLGEEDFKRAWDWCIQQRIIIAERKVSDELAAKLNVNNKSTAGRTVFNHLLFEDSA